MTTKTVLTNEQAEKAINLINPILGNYTFNNKRNTFRHIK